MSQRPDLLREESPTSTPRDGNCLIHGKNYNTLIFNFTICITFSAIVDQILNNDALKNNKEEHLNETWTRLVRDLKLYDDIEDLTNFLRRRWVVGSAEWLSGKNGSRQNDKVLFDYDDDQWEYIWSSMIEDGAWAVPGIKDNSGNVIKDNFAPEMMIKYIAHDIRCHIIIFDLQLSTVQFCSGNHLREGNVEFDSPIIL